jgi:hypothetical protein
MAEPAKKLDHGHPSRPSHPAKPDRRPRVVPLQRRKTIPPGADTWVLEQIVRWYQFRCE